jgi:hypothetical protein
MDKWEKKRRAKEWTWADEIRAFKKQLGMEKEKRTWAEEIEAIDKKKTLTTLGVLAAIGLAIGLYAILIAVNPDLAALIIGIPILLLVFLGPPVLIAVGGLVLLRDLLKRLGL